MSKEIIQVRKANIKTACFAIEGNAPLVIHRFSVKQADILAGKQGATTEGAAKRERVGQAPEDVYNQARYIAKNGGWDGFNASAIRTALIDACRLIGYKMTFAKMSVFVIQEGWDKFEPQVPLIRILGDPIMQRDVGRVANGNPYIIYRPAYHNWSAKITIRWDADQFTLDGVTNLLARVGSQVGIGEGRPFSKNSAGMGWGTFDVATAKEARKAS